jgi:Zn-dependent M28 family amino/carboxypeptidase
VWIAFLDGEEAFNLEWKDPDNTYGSRELAARLAVSGDLKRVKAVLLADMIGSRDLRVKRETNSTTWLTDLVWSTASRLGYSDIFVSSTIAVEDDHIPFLRRSVPSVDIIDMEIPYWHTPQDTLDKLSPTSLAVVGHVLIAVMPQLEQKFAKPGAAARP